MFALNLMDAITLCFNIEVYVFTSITTKIVKIPTIFYLCVAICFGCAYSHLQASY